MSAHPMNDGDEQSGAARTQADDRRLVAFGAILMLAGLIAVVARAADVDIGAVVGEQTWPLLVIVPGLGLLGFAFVRTPPDGLGFAIAGSIVTAVG